MSIKSVSGNESISSHLVLCENGDIVTTLILDQQTFDQIWDRIEQFDLINVLDGSPLDLQWLRGWRASQRLPMIQRSAGTDFLFQWLGVETERFCGIVRGAGARKLEL